MISTFDKEYAFLSNFYSSPLFYNGLWYPTVEHAFQAAKTHDEFEQLAIANAETPGQAKRMGRKVKLRDDWDVCKRSIMTDLVREKFRQNPDLRRLLLATGIQPLIEGNTWHDNIWGQCTCPRCKDIQGANWLGQALMLVRTELQSERQP